LGEIAYGERMRHQRFGLSKTESRRLANTVIERMTMVFDDSMIDNWQPLEGSFGLRDPNDEHAVATAVVAHASVIVTTNLGHFPAPVMPAGIQAVGPADFTARIARTLPDPAVTALLEMSARLRNPVMSPSDLLDYFDNHYQMNEATAVLRHRLPK